MTDVLAVLAGLLVGSAVIVTMMTLSACLAVRSVVRRARRSAWMRSAHRQTVAQRRDLAMSVVQLRAVAMPVGSRGEIARLRVRVHTSARHTERVLEAARSGGTQPVEFAEMLHSLTSRASQLDRHLALIEREPDAPLRAAQLANVQPWAEQLITDSNSLREAAYRLADDLRGLHQPRAGT